MDSVAPLANILDITGEARLAMNADKATAFVIITLIEHHLQAHSLHEFFWRSDMALSTLSRSISGEVAIVTGAASGMGRATAHLFGDEGARVALIDINSEALEAVVKEMTDVGYDAKGWVLDLSDADAIHKVIGEIGEHFGGIDILVNNAGISIPTPIDSDEYPSAWDKVLSVLLTAHTHTIRAALPFLRQSAHGRIVNIASTEALGATRFGSPYTAAKTGVTGLTRSLAVELGPENITVNCICPGPIRTGMTDAIPEENKIIFAKRRTALRRYAEPEEVAHGTLSFVLPASQYITGAVLPVDGGLTIRNA
jgi:3-oxoacyl-[acyl-carrier protein] reductase